MLVSGIFLYACVYTKVCPKDSIWADMAEKGADVLVIGVILGYFTNIAKMFGIFKEELRGIVYLEEHLQKRNDLDKLWDAASKQMFKNKFPVIHSDFLEAIKTYFPNNEVSYYNNYNAFIKVEWEDRDNHIIKVTDSISFELIPENKEGKIFYPLRTWTCVNDGDRHEENLLSFSVNGVRQEIGTPEVFYEGGEECRERVFEMKNQEKYEIRYEREKIYNIDTDYFIAFRAKYIVNNLSVTLSLPEGIKALFSSRGTQKNYADGINPDCINKIYHGIIFPRQGYFFALRRTE